MLRGVAAVRRLRKRPLCRIGLTLPRPCELVPKRYMRTKEGLPHLIDRMIHAYGSTAATVSTADHSAVAR